MGTKIICAMLLALCCSMQTEVSGYHLTHPKSVALKPAVGEDGVLTIEYMRLPTIGHERYIDDSAYAKNNENIKKVVVKGSIEFIGDQAFRYCPNLQEVDLSEAYIRRIGHAAFMGCPQLKSVKLNPNSKWMKIEGYSFADCPELAEIEIPEGATVESTTFKGSPKVPVAASRGSGYWKGMFTFE